MATIGLASFEIHPTTPGGCGVLLHHSAEHLLRDGHSVVFLLDIPRKEFVAFRDRDRLTLPNAERCRAYSVRELSRDMLQPPPDCPPQVEVALRFDHAYRRLARVEPMDFFEFFDYCGVGHYAMVRRIFGQDPPGPVLGVRLHNPLELIDRHSPSNTIGRGRYALYGLERAAIDLAEAVLTPTRAYYEAYFRDGYDLDERRVVVSQSPKSPFPEVEQNQHRGGPIRIVFVGRMWHFKGVDQLVRAGVALLRSRPDLDCAFELIGPDSRESPFHDSFIEYLRTLMPADLRSRFVFPGHITHEQIAGRLGGALFAVFPNLFESFCYALHEVYDAGLPVVVNDLPGFADFFEHGHNAYVYDGTAEGLCAAMAAMIDNPQLRQRLTRPYRVATNPLGPFYARPRARSPLVLPDDGQSPTMSPLVLVLDRVNPDHQIGVPPAEDPDSDPALSTLDALSKQTAEGFRVLRLVATEPDSEETLWLLGRPWHVRTPEGDPVAPGTVRTGDGLVLLEAGDRPDPSWLLLCAEALRRRPSLPFAGTWGRRPDGSVHPLLIDLAPETWPYERGDELTRLLLRTEPGRLLIDVFDEGLGSLGEIGYVWRAVERWGGGAVLPEPLMEFAPTPSPSVDPQLLTYLVARYGKPFEGRLALYSTLLLAGSLERADRAVPSAPKHPAPARSDSHTRHAPAVTVEEKIRIADELGGRTLARMAAAKLARRVRAPGTTR